MKIVLFVLSILAVTAAVETRAEAQNYPWCAIYTGSMGGSTNCGFTSFEQCMADVSGLGGFCQRNNTYVPPGAPPLRRKPHHHY